MESAAIFIKDSNTASGAECSTPASSNLPAAVACAAVIVGRAGYTRMKKLSEFPADGGAESHLIGAAKGDGKLTFDKLTDLYHSGTKHEEDQPAHLIIHDTICAVTMRCRISQPLPAILSSERLRNARRFFCAKWQTHQSESSNCVHCKACDIQDPYQIITWVPPEGGGGPNYDGM